MSDAEEMLHRNVVRVVEAGAAIGLTVEPVRFPEGTKTAVDAAKAIGCDVGQIVKSLIFGVDGEVVLAYVSGANQLDEAKLAAAAGGLRCSRVDADMVAPTTGFPIGGVPPFGHDTDLRVFVDPDLLQYDVVWAAAGTWHDVFSLTPQQLIDASGGRRSSNSAAAQRSPTRRRDGSPATSDAGEVERFGERVPAEHGALDAHRELDDALERLEIAHRHLVVAGLLVVALDAHHAS